MSGKVKFAKLTIPAKSFSFKETGEIEIWISETGDLNYCIKQANGDDFNLSIPAAYAKMIARMVGD